MSHAALSWSLVIVQNLWMEHLHMAQKHHQKQSPGNGYSFLFPKSRLQFMWNQARNKESSRKRVIFRITDSWSISTLVLKGETTRNAQPSCPPKPKSRKKSQCIFSVYFALNIYYIYLITEVFHIYYEKYKKWSVEDPTEQKLNHLFTLTPSFNTWHIILNKYLS